MEKISRKELKEMVRHDRFAEEVKHGVQYVAGHKRQMLIFGGVAVLAIIAAVGTYFYMQSKRAERQSALHEVMRVYDAAVGPATSEFVISFKTIDEKNKAAAAALNGLIAKYPGSDEAVIARNYLGASSSDQGNLAEAEKHFRAVIDSGHKEYAPLAKLSLAELLASQGKRDEAEKLLKPLVDNPTVLVSKEQATLALARVIAPSRPADARKLLEPLRTERSAVSRAAITALSEMPSK